MTPANGTLDDKARSEARMLLQKAQAVIYSEPQEALNLLLEAKQLDPKNLDILLELGRLQVRTYNFAEATNTLTRAIDMGGPSDEALALLALAHRRLKHFDEASTRAREALKLRPQNITARDVLADCLIHQRRWEDALVELNQLNANKALSNLAVAKISGKAACCLYGLGNYHLVWEITSTLIENGYSNVLIQNLYHVSEERAKADVEKHLGSLTFTQRLFSKLYDKALLNVFMLSRRGMDSLRRENALITNNLMKHQSQAVHLEQRANEAERASKTDFLTGLPNRTCLMLDWVPKIGDRPCAIIAVDLDKFKWVNDTHGHDGGDMVLRKMAEIGSRTFRHPDGNLFRFGGEEFVALVFGPENVAMRMAESFRQELEQRAAEELAAAGGLPLKDVIIERLRAKGQLDLKPNGWGLVVWDEDNQELRPRQLTASIGVSMYPDGNSSFDEVLRKADNALYKAKADGRNKVVRWVLGMDGAADAVPGTPNQLEEGTTATTTPRTGAGSKRRLAAKRTNAVRPVKDQGASVANPVESGDPDLPDDDERLASIVRIIKTPIAPRKQADGPL